MEMKIFLLIITLIILFQNTSFESKRNTPQLLLEQDQTDEQTDIEEDNQDEEDEKDIEYVRDPHDSFLELSGDSLEHALYQFENLLVCFYNPNEQESVKSLAVFRGLHKMLVHDLQYTFAKIDCSRHGEDCALHDITTLPHLLYFIYGDPVSFTQKFTLPNLAAWITSIDNKHQFDEDL